MAAPQIEAGLRDYYAEQGGNANGVPVETIPIAGLENSLGETLSWINQKGYERGLDDTGVFAAFGLYGIDGRVPRYVVINGLADSASHAQWEVLYNATGFQGAAEYREIIDSVFPAGGGGGSHLFSGLVDVGGGWRESPWFGWLVPSGDSWAYHNEHGWIFVPTASTEASMYYYHEKLGWLWTSDSAYPSLYSFGRSSWLEYSEGSGSWFYDWSLGEWVQI